MNKFSAYPDDGAPSSVIGRLWCWALIPVLSGLDLWSKSAAFACLEAAQPTLPEAQRSLAVWEGLLSFSLTSWRNTGTIWGIGQQYNVPLTILRCIAIVLLAVMLWRTPQRKRTQQLVLAMIIAGALGNLYDNFWEVQGGVRDFLLFYLDWGNGETTAWPAFNVADALISVGAISLIITVWRGDRAEARASTENSA